MNLLSKQEKRKSSHRYLHKLTASPLPVSATPAWVLYFLPTRQAQHSIRVGSLDHVPRMIITILVHNNNTKLHVVENANNRNATEGLVATCWWPSEVRRTSNLSKASSSPIKEAVCPCRTKCTDWRRRGRVHEPRNTYNITNTHP